jgi:tetratricopeptide (TPR) repeat protein
MTAPTTPDEIAAALVANDHAPYGPTRTRRAEQLVEFAEQTGDRPLLVRALQQLIEAREFDGHADEILVPFARVMRMWDEHPGDFDEGAVHSLHWHFKWVSSSVLSHPGIPLSAIERWREEMADRYRQAGYGLHAVYARRHFLAAHLGHGEEAARWFDEWLAADRDDMSDCHACDRNGQGEWLVQVGRDEEALAVWAPVLRGELRCTEEPHRVLAKSLLPLVRLGRLGEARNNHLRGYQMARGNASLRRAVAEHLEFAALTGNETRGLEMLAEHAGWLAPDNVDPWTRFEFLEGVAVLLARLRELGHADLPVPSPRGTTPTTPVGELLPAVLAEIAELTGRFDERNGTPAVGGRSRTRLAQRPLVDLLPLGVRSAPLAPARPVPAGSTGSPDALVAHARQLDEVRHPDSHVAWERVAASGAVLPPNVLARIAQSRALARRGDPAAARPLFLAAAQRFVEAGEPGPAAANRSRAGLAALIGGDPQAARADLDAALSTVDGSTDRDAAVVALCRARAAWYRVLTGDASARAELDTELERAASVVDALGEAYHLGSLELLRAQTALAADDRDGARPLLERTVEAYTRAGSPWEAAFPRSVLAELALREGDLAAGEGYARQALADARDPDVRANVSRLLAQAYWGPGGRDAEVVDLALAAAHRYDETRPADAAQLRLLAAHAFHRSGRFAEAAALLETALPDLDEHADEADRVEGRRLTAQCLREQGEPEPAARLLLAAATIAQGWPDQTGHATLAHEAAAALQSAGHGEEAERAYARAADLWQTVGDLASRIRAIRARAWLLADRDLPGALALFDAAAAELSAADPGERWELPETLRQAAHLVMQWHENADPDPRTVRRGLALAEDAARGFAAVDDFPSLASARLLAAEFEVLALDRREDGLARVRGLADECRTRGETALVTRCEQYLSWLAGQ